MISDNQQRQTQYQFNINLTTNKIEEGFIKIPEDVNKEFNIYNGMKIRYSIVERWVEIYEGWGTIRKEYYDVDFITDQTII
jgi:hypothetical protein